MPSADFPFALCPLKHYVRMEAWLPLCRRRLNELRAGKVASKVRRLRYFTFCATDAMDVLMLDVAKVIRPSKGGRFDTVFFFTRSDEAVVDTRKSVPGSTGFPGEFIDVVLCEDEGIAQRLLTEPVEAIAAALSDTVKVRKKLNRALVHRDLKDAFPFDVINLDLEGYLFRPSEAIPGRMINAFRQIFQWQQAKIPPKRLELVDTFGLMFTTKIGPQNLGEDFRDMLRTALRQNLERDTTLPSLLEARTGQREADVLLGVDFEAFFRLAAPKIIARTLLEEDWYVDPTTGIQVFQFERQPVNGPAYRMLHLAMDVRRHQPAKPQRAPGVQSTIAEDGYSATIRRLFESVDTNVTLEVVDIDKIEKSLERIAARRRKYQDGG